MTKRTAELRRETYHEIFVPFPDVYHMSGSDVFTNLERKVSSETQGERNLIVLPIGYSDRLGYLEKHEQSEGSSSALKFISGAKEKKHATLEIGDARVTIYRTSEGLDVAYIDDQQFNGEIFDMNSLGELVSKFTKVTNKEKIPLKLMTNTQSDHLKFDSRGFVIEEPQFLQVNEDIVNQGIISGTAELQAKLNESSDRSLSLDETVELLSGSGAARELYVNQFIRFQGKQTQFAVVTAEFVYNKSNTRIIGLKNQRVRLLPQHDYDMKIRIGNAVLDDVVGISPRDMEQKITMQYGIFNPKVALLFVAGKRGSGKTILDFAGIDQVLVYPKDEAIRRGWRVDGKTGLYKKVIMIKAPEILGGKRREMGFLPGNEFEKIEAHLQPYIDAHEESIFEELGIPFQEFIKHPKYANKYGQRSEAVNSKKIGLAYLPPHSPLMEVRSPQFIGGASLSRTLMFIDEAQDFTPYEMKTMIERAGEDSKLIISGDPAQTRNPFCSRKYNGFTFAIKNYLARPYSMLTRLNKNYRHQMSEDAEEMNVQNPI